MSPDTAEMDDVEIIDIHTHLGSIIDEGGGDVIDEKGRRLKHIPLDTGWLLNLFYKLRGKIREPGQFVRAWATLSGRHRIANATLENMQKALEGTGISKSCVLPIPPNVCFDDLKNAQEADDRVIPFTGVDFTDFENFAAQLKKDVTEGAKGMKVHPIIQNVSPVDERMSQALDEFAQYDLPALVHSGRVTYYFGEEKRRENPDYGRMELIEQMVKNNRGKTKIILGHAGLSEFAYALERMPQYPNVFVDTTFKHPGHIRELINAFGSERVLFGSDWPYGDMKPSVKCARLALEQEGDRQTYSRVFRDNAMNLLHLD